MFRFKSQSAVLIFLAATLLVFAGCGGGGSSTSAGTGSGTTRLSGNVIGFGPAQTSIEHHLKKGNYAQILIQLTVPFVYAGERVIEGIEVCVVGVCDTTDADGSFTLNLDGIAAGTYTMTLSYDGDTYSTDIQVQENAIISLDGVSISDDGVVRISNVRVQLLEQADDDDDDKDERKVVVCHRPGTPAEQTLEIAEPALTGHLGHGDTEGPCPPK